MSEINKDNFIEVLKYNGWKYSKINDLYTLLSGNSYSLDTANLQVKEQKFGLIIIQVPSREYIDNFISMCVKYFSLKPLPVVNNIADYIIANFKQEGDYSNYYIYNNYTIIVWSEHIQIYNDINCSTDGAIYFIKMPFDKQLKLLNMFLKRNDEN